MDELYRPSKPRRRSNASVHLLTSKFEVIEAEPVFEENLHGPSAEDYSVLEKTMSTDSTLSDAGTTTSSEGGDDRMAK
jgi:hypothetical protein